MEDVRETVRSILGVSSLLKTVNAEAKNVKLSIKNSSQGDYKMIYWIRVISITRKGRRK